MLARSRFCLAAAWLMAMTVNAFAASDQPAVGPAPPLTGYSAAESPIERSSEANAYNRAAITDPYNQKDFSAQQSFGLTASQMLGAAAACEQFHSDLTSGQRAKPSKDPSDDNRAALDAAQQNMLSPAATAPNPLQTGEVDCDRVSGAFRQLQQIQARDPDLAKALGQTDAVSPLPDRNNRSNGGR